MFYRMRPSSPHAFEFPTKGMKVNISRHRTLLFPAFLLFFCPSSLNCSIGVRYSVIRKTKLLNLNSH